MKRFRCITETVFYEGKSIALGGEMVESPNGEYVLYEDAIAEEEEPTPECPFPMGARVTSKKNGGEYIVVGWERSIFSGEWCLKFEGSERFWLPWKFKLLPEVKKVKTGICHLCGYPMFEWIRASNWDPEWKHRDPGIDSLHHAVESRPEPPRGSVVEWDGAAWHRPAGLYGYRIVGGPLNFQDTPPLWSAMHGAVVLYEKPSSETLS
jgi:hypothetical protein